MMLPTRSRTRGWGWLGTLLAAAVLIVALPSLTGAQDANPPAAARNKARERQKATNKKPTDPKSADPSQAEGEPAKENAPTVPPMPQPVTATHEPAPAATGLESAGNPDPAGAGAPPNPTEVPRPVEETQIDPAKRVEEAQRAAQERARARRERALGPGANPMPVTVPGQANPPATPPGFTPPTEMAGDAQGDGGPSTPLNIAPDESTVPAEDRTYGFSIKDGTYEQLIEGFARQTGLGVIGEAPKDGKVTFVTTETLNFDQALARVRMLLFNYKPHEPYWILRNESNLQVIRVNDFYRILPRNRMFSSIEEFREAKLSNDELALVIYTPKSGSVAALRQVRDWLPDYVRVTPLEDQNRVTIFALVSDIEKYMELIRFILQGGSMDPRTLERIEIHHILANDALTKLRSLMELDGAGGMAAGRGAAAQQPRRGTPREPSLLDNLPDPPVSVIADDVQGLLIVRAMQDKIDEMKLLLPYIDVDTSSSIAQPTIIKVQYIDANDMISIVQQVLTSSGSPGGAPATPKPKRGKKAGAVVPAATSGEGSGGAIVMLGHPAENAIIVLADEAGVARVGELVRMFDVPPAMNPIRISLAYADAGEALTTVTSVLGMAGKPGKPALDRFQLVVDPTGDSVWFTGAEHDLARVRELISMIDVAEDPVALHVVTCKYQPPTFIANMLREFDSTNPGSAAPAAARKKPKTKRAKASAPASKFTPDDGRKQLFIICTEEEWTRYQELMAKLDRPADLDDAFVRIAVEHVDPNRAIERLLTMLPAPVAGEDATRMVPSDGAILVLGANAQELERVRTFLTEVDKPVTIEKRTFEIHHANAADIKTAIESLMTDTPLQTTRRRGKGEAKNMGGVTSSVSPDLTILQVGQRLVVQTSPERMEQVASLVAEFDVEEGKTELKVYSDFAPGTNIEALSETVSSVFGGSGRGGRRNAKEAPGTDGPRFLPQPASGRLVVIAEPTVFPEIERLLTVLRHEVESRPMIVAFVEVTNADSEELVETVRPLLDIKIQGLVQSGELDDGVEDAAPNVPTKGSKRRASMGGGATSDRYHLSADRRNRRIVVAAPQVVVDQAKALIAQFDLPGDKPILKRVELTNAEPGDMVQAVKEMMGRPATRTKSTPKAGGKASASTPSFELSAETGLSIVESPGGGAVLLHGHPTEVAQAEEWVRQLDAMSSRGRMIKVYEVKKADMDKLFDLIVNVVGASPGGGKGAAPLPKGKASQKEDDEEAFATSRTHSSGDLYIQVDLIGKTMMVAATPSKIGQIDDIVNRMDSDPQVVEAMKPTPEVPKFLYELEYADAMDAAWELEGVLKSMWEPADELPRVDTAGFGNALIVRYPDRERFDDIRDLIRRYADKEDKAKTRIVRVSKSPPPGLSAQEVAVWFKMNHPEFEVELEDTGPEHEETFDIERLKPLTPSTKVHPCVLPGVYHRTADALLAELVGQAQPEPAEEEPIEEEEPYVEPIPVPNADDMIRQAVTPLVKEKGKGKEKSDEKGTEKKSDAKDSKSDREKSKKAPAGNKITVRYNNIDGTVQFEGQAGDIEGVSDSMEDLEKEIEKFPVKPDIRIYRVRYIDVNSAQDILEEMFNTTKQQTAQLQAQQQAAMRQQQMQQQQQRQQQPGGKGQPGGEQGPGGAGGPQAGGPGGGRVPGGQPGQVPGQMPGQFGVAQLPQAGVRIYPNPRDRTLILRAETSQYPQILELLATIDQPKPIESFIRTYPLKILNAGEVEDTLRELLGLEKGATKSRASRGAGAAGTPGVASGGGPGESLPQTITQKTVSGLSELGVDPEDIKLFSSDISNTVMAMAPVAALDFIGELIQKLESEDIPQRLTRYYTLKNADADDVVDYLGQHFAEKTRSGGKLRKGGAEGAAAPTASGDRAMNSPSFVPYARLNLVTVHATQVQMDEVETLLERLDVKGSQEKWETVVLAYADAKVVGDTLTQIFGEKAGSTSGKSGGKGSVAKFVGESGGGVLFYNAPASLKDQVVAAIQKIEEQSKETRTPRIIELKNGTPSSIAEAIEKAYDAKQGASKSGAAGKTRFTITGHDPSKRLFVIADDKTFAEVEALAKLLDDKPGTIGVEFRVYPMQYGNAKTIHAQLTKLLKDYMSRLGPKANEQIEAFSVEPDEISNSLIVLGGPTVFGFIEENLRTIDTPTSAIGKPASLIVPISNGSATEIATNIKVLYTGKEQPLGVTPPIVEANPATNVLIVRGSQQQIDEIKRDIIDPLEAQIGEARKVQNKPIKLKFADPGNVQDAINKLFRTESRIARDQVQAVAEFTSNSVIISASPDNLKRVEELIAKIDSADASQQNVHVVEIKHADSQSVAQTLTEIFVRAGPRQGGNQAPPITIAAVPGSRAILIKCKGEDFTRIQETLASLDTEDVGTAGEVRMVTLLYSDAGEVSQALEKYLRTTGAGGRGDKLLGDARISAMPQTNTLMISAAKGEVERLVDITKIMDIAGEKGSIPQIIPLKFANVGMILPSVQEIFTERSGGGRRNQAPPVIVADEGSNALIVRASPMDMTSIQGIVTQLDTEDKIGKSPFRIIAVKPGLNVTELAEQIETTLNESAQAQAGSARGRQSPRVTVTPNLWTSSLVVAGYAPMFDQAEALVRKLEEMGPAGDRVTAIVPMRRTKVEDIQRLIDQLTQQPGGGTDSRRGTSGRPRPARRP